MQGEGACSQSQRKEEEEICANRNIKGEEMVAGLAAACPNLRNKLRALLQMISKWETIEVHKNAKLKNRVCKGIPDALRSQAWQVSTPATPKHGGGIPTEQFTDKG